MLRGTVICAVPSYVDEKKKDEREPSKYITAIIICLWN